MWRTFERRAEEVVGQCTYYLQERVGWHWYPIGVACKLPLLYALLLGCFFEELPALAEKPLDHDVEVSS